jgi:tRNA (guanine37-N1)-methyltransferase
MTPECLPVTIVTLFPAMFEGWLENGGVARARSRGVISVEFSNPREFGLGTHLQVDDYPFGGGAGMVMRPEPLFGATESIEGVSDGPIVLLSPRGRVFDQTVAHDLAAAPRLTLIAGHYEGVDERVATHLATDELSIGDYVLSGGELAAMVVVDAVARILPGAINHESVCEESFVGHLLEYPQYTRPADFRGWSVPEVLISGHHAKVAAWRRQQAEERTRRSRPDLMKSDAEPRV